MLIAKVFNLEADLAGEKVTGQKRRKTKKRPPPPHTTTL